MKPQSMGVRAFKNELRNYKFYKERIKSLDELIEYCYDLLGASPKSRPTDKEPTHTPRNIDAEYKVREEIARHERNKAITQTKIDYIDSILELIETPLKTALKSIYVNNEKVERVADKMYYSKSNLIYKLNKAIDSAINSNL